MRRVLAAIALVLSASACQATILVGVDATAGGSGVVQATVTLDQEAATRLAQLGGAKLDDLRRAGWTVDGPVAGAGGTTVFRASKPFGTVAQANGVVGELSGAKGPFREFRLTRRTSLFESVTNFSGTVDLQAAAASEGTGSVAGLGSLGAAGSDLGVNVAALSQQLNTDLNRLFRVRVTVRLPGQLTTSNSPAPASNGASWQPQFGEVAQLSASARTWNGAHLALAILLGIVVVAAIAAGGVVVVRRRR